VGTNFHLTRFPWDFVEIMGSPVLMRDVAAELVREFAVSGLAMALCVCGWVSDRESAMTIRPGQFIQRHGFSLSLSLSLSLALSLTLCSTPPFPLSLSHSSLCHSLSGEIMHVTEYLSLPPSLTHSLPPTHPSTLPPSFPPSLPLPLPLSQARSSTSRSMAAPGRGGAQ
jgi:hypothetical protein